MRGALKALCHAANLQTELFDAAESPSFAGRAALFWRAGAVVGPHGGASYNVLWSRRGTTFVEIVFSDWINDIAPLALSIGLRCACARKLTRGRSPARPHARTPARTHARTHARTYQAGLTLGQAVERRFEFVQQRCKDTGARFFFSNRSARADGELPRARSKWEGGGGSVSARRVLRCAQTDTGPRRSWSACAETLKSRRAQPSA